MNREIALIVLMFNVLLSCISQVILKLEANKPHATKMSEIVNKGVFLGYTIFLTITLVNVFMYRYVEFNLILVIESLAYVFVPLISYKVFKEKLNKKQLIGLMIIVAGVIMYAIAS